MGLVRDLPRINGGYPTLPSLRARWFGEDTKGEGGKGECPRGSDERKEALAGSSMKTILLCILCTAGQGKGKPEGMSTVPSPRERVSSLRWYRYRYNTVQYYTQVQGLNGGLQLGSCCCPQGDRNHPEWKGREI